MKSHPSSCTLGHSTLVLEHGLVPDKRPMHQTGSLRLHDTQQLTFNPVKHGTIPRKESEGPTVELSQPPRTSPLPAP